MNMNKQIITRQAVNQVLSDYWRQYWTHSWIAIAAFFTPAIGSIFVFFVPPLIVAKIINIFIEQNEISLSTAGVYIALLGGSWLFGEILWRVGLHYLIKLEAKGINNLCKTAFQRLMERGYDFMDLFSLDSSCIDFLDRPDNHYCSPDCPPALKIGSNAA